MSDRGRRKGMALNGMGGSGHSALQQRRAVRAALRVSAAQTAYTWEAMCLQSYRVTPVRAAVPPPPPVGANKAIAAPRKVRQQGRTSREQVPPGYYVARPLLVEIPGESAGAGGKQACDRR